MDSAKLEYKLCISLSCSSSNVGMSSLQNSTSTDSLISTIYATPTSSRITSSTRAMPSTNTGNYKINNLNLAKCLVLIVFYSLVNKY